MRTYLIAMLMVLGISMLFSCSEKPSGSSAKAPTFKLAWSEYPSWSVFGVAHEKGLINGEAGVQGPIEKEFGVDIELIETDYDTCITMFASGTTDAVCITNMDVLNPALTRPSVAILPTSTSFGADALIVTGVNSLEELKSHKVYGLEKSVSEYCFVRNIEKAGLNPADFQFANMDPAAAAQAMITKQDGYNAIIVWNPFVLETLKKRDDAKVLFDSTGIPGEIIDMVAMAQSSLDKPGGEAFAKAVAKTYYELNKMLADPATGDETLVALGAKFSSLGLEKMKTVVQQTKFYKTPDEGMALFTGAELPGIMKTVVGFCKTHDIVGSEPAIAYPNADTAEPALLFTDKYMKAVQ